MSAARPKERRPSQQDLARAAGVSISTVSRALADAPGISRELRRQIQDLAETLGYAGRTARSAPLAATAYVALQSATGGLAAFYEEIVQSLVAEAAGTIEIRLRLVEENALTPAIMAQDAAAIGSPAIFLVGIDPEPALADALLAAGVPVVLVNGADPLMRFDGVAPANFYGAMRGAGLLLAEGHRSLLYVTSRLRWTTRQRLRGVEAAIAGTQDARLEICELPAPTREDAEAEIRKRLRGGARDWTAIFCMNDLFAIGVLRALERARLPVPRAISVLGFDDLPFAAMTSPRLATLRVHRHEIGRAAIRLMQRRIAQPDTPMLQVEVAVSPTPGGTLGRAAG